MAGKSEKDMVKIKLPRTPGKGNNDVFVSVNCENYLIKRGETVEVPDYVLEVLEHSEQQAEIADSFIDKHAT